MSAPSLTMRRNRSVPRFPDCAEPRTSPSLRSSRSTRASSNPSVVAASAPSRWAATVPSGASATSRHSPGALPRPDAAAQLVQLRETEDVGVEDHHDRGRGHVDTDLDDRRRHEHGRAARREVGDGPVLLLARHPPVQEPDGGAAQPRVGPQRLGDLEDGAQRLLGCALRGGLAPRRRSPARPGRGRQHRRPRRRRRSARTPRTPGRRARPPRAPGSTCGPSRAGCRPGRRGW